MTKQLAVKYRSFSQYRIRLNEPWEITIEQWHNFFAVPENRTALLDKTKRITRINAVEPWRIDNIALVPKKTPPVVKPPKQKKVYLPKSDHADWTVLSVDQWLAEVRENRRSE